MAVLSHRKSENKPPEMTIERAVNLLTQDNEDMLICAASHIQNQCFKSADAKKMVCLIICLYGTISLIQVRICLQLNIMESNL